MKTSCSFLYILLTLIMIQCGPSIKNKELCFTIKIVEDEANNWWARSLVDINGDGLKDIVLQHDNRNGGWLGWYETVKDTNSWIKHIISDSSKMGETFASGDIEAGDFDNDGDIDVLGFIHKGESKGNSGYPTNIYYFENPEWKEHFIGQAPAFVKDVEKADFNQDGKLDIVVNTYVKNSLQVFIQSDTGWIEALSITIMNLHEGMAVGDIDGDGYPDIAANGYWIKSPANDITEKWELYSIDEKWYNQEGDWSKNATKNYCADIDKDGKDEVFISHSEREGFPISWYDLTGTDNNMWEEHIIDTNMAACHSLQVFDFDNDGDLDILAGENQNRWGGEDKDDPVKLYLNKGDNISFIQQLLTNNGIYNGLAGDIDNDGDYDIMRLPGHRAETLEIWLNQLK